MKTLPGPLATHYGLASTTITYALKITRTDAQVFAFTGASESVTIGGTMYTAAQGLDVTNVDLTAGLAVDNLELTTLNDGTLFNKREVLAGKWRNADFVLSRYNWASPSDGLDTIMVGTVGEVVLSRTTVTAELRGLQQYLQQPVGSVTSKTCRARLGDALCRVDLAPYTFTGTITSVTSQQIITDSARSELPDFFTEGLITFTSGTASGLSAKIKTHAASGVFTLSLPILLTLNVGDTYSVIAGCRKRISEDCGLKFNNIINFQGEPHLPGIDALAQ